MLFFTHQFLNITCIYKKCCRVCHRRKWGNNGQSKMDILISIPSQHPLDQDIRIGFTSRNRNYRFNSSLLSHRPLIQRLSVVFSNENRNESPNWSRSKLQKSNVLSKANSTANIACQQTLSMQFSPNSTKSSCSGRAYTSIESESVQSAGSGTTL